MKKLINPLFFAFITFILSVILSASVSAEIHNGICGDEGNNVTYELNTETGIIEIKGTGHMHDFFVAGPVNYHLEPPWHEYCDYIKTVKIAYGITHIGCDSFSYCENLTKVILPQSIKSVGGCAFYGCTQLKSISLPKNIDLIGEGAFCYSGLEKVRLPDGIESIYGYTFSGCPLKSITFPKGLKEIGEHAFYGASLEHIEIPDNVSYIEPDAFSDTTYYNDETNWANGKILYIGNFLIDIKDKSIESLYIKDGTKYIASRALWDCNNIKNISIPASFIGDIDEILRLDTLSEIKIDNKNKVYSKIDDVIFSESGKRLLKYPKSKKATSYSIPKGVTSIADNAFSGCVYLTEIIIPKGVTSIGSEAFMGCDSLAEIIIPEGATNLEYNAFIECKSITRIVIPKSVTDDYISFSGCEKLEEIIIHADMMPGNLEDTAFYKSSSNWHEGKVLYLNNQLIDAKSDMTGHYSIKEGTLSIQEFAFDRDSKLTSITIPKSVKNIEYYSFFGNNLSEISVDEENEFYCDIDGVLFTKDKKTLLTYPKNGAETYTVPSSVTTIAFCAFLECSSLKSLILPNSITEIEESAFSYCKNLKSIVLSESIKEITSGVFSNCKSLHSITIPSSVEVISNDAFFECENLKTAIIKSKNIEFTYDYVYYPIFESGDINDVHFPKTLILNKDCNLTEYSDIFNMIYFEDIESNCKRITDNLENLFQTIKANHKDIFRTVFSVANTFSFFSGILQALVINS